MTRAWLLALLSAGCYLSRSTHDPHPAPTVGAGDAESEDGAPAGPDGGRDAGEDADPCAPQRARFVGECPGHAAVVWDGAHCVALVGCECVGPDCATLFTSVEDCVEARRACFPRTCTGQVAYDDPCSQCRALPQSLGVFWTGSGCIELSGCACLGQDCGSGFASIEECTEVQKDCAATRCQATGGRWFPERACTCGFRCGVPNACGQCVEACDCGPGRTSAADVGCVEDETCSAEELCLATNGQWACVCDECGGPRSCDECESGCDCGAARRFDPEAGCVFDSACGPATPATVCASTGGVWHDEACGHYECGRPSPDPCATGGCDCGLFRELDEVLGCVYVERCASGLEYQPCVSSSQCRPGLACCSYPECFPSNCGAPECPCCGG